MVVINIAESESGGRFGGCEKPTRQSGKRSLLDRDVFANNEVVRSHLFEARKNAVYVFVGVNKDHDDGQFPAGIDQMVGLDTLSSNKARDRVKYARAVNVFIVKIVKHCEMQRLALPPIGFV